MLRPWENTEIAQRVVTFFFSPLRMGLKEMESGLFFTAVSISLADLSWCCWELHNTTKTSPATHVQPLCPAQGHPDSRQG